MAQRPSHHRQKGAVQWKFPTVNGTKLLTFAALTGVARFVLGLAFGFDFILEVLELPAQPRFYGLQLINAVLQRLCVVRQLACMARQIALGFGSRPCAYLDI